VSNCPECSYLDGDGHARRCQFFDSKKEAEEFLRKNSVILVVGNAEDFQDVNIGHLKPDKKYILAILEIE
jgi:hypothetical protein